MKSRSILWALSLLSVACGGPNSGTQSDGSTTEQSDYGRYPTGTFLLSQDVKYDKACNDFGEGYIRSTFDVDAGTEITTVDGHTGCDFVWNNKKQVTLSTTGEKPFASIYQAEFYFDSLYQPTEFARNRRPHHPAYSGPFTEDTDAEGPTAGMTNHTMQGAGYDSSAVNDTAYTVARNTGAAAQLTPAATNSAAGKAIAGVGDKAVWDDNKRTLHVLYLHHVLHVMVNHGPTPTADLAHARQLAMVWMDKMSKEGQGGIETPPDNPIYR